MNAITDVDGVTVGHVTLVSGEGKLIVGQGPVRTGLTAILPRGKAGCDRVFAGYFSLNGNGEMTGMHWVEESGFLEGPVMLTNTHSVGIVRDAIIEWQITKAKISQPWALPAARSRRQKVWFISPAASSTSTVPLICGVEQQFKIRFAGPGRFRFTGEGQNVRGAGPINP